MQVFYNIVVFITVALLIISLICYIKNKKEILRIRPYGDIVFYANITNVFLTFIRDDCLVKPTLSYLIAVMSFGCYVITFTIILNKIANC